ncbi:MAG: general secretion pathway protein GspB [Pseudomonadota bacterium]
MLDALKKADAERERGAVPGLHAQPVPGLLDVPVRRPVVPAWAWMLAGAAVMLPAAWLGMSLLRDAPVAPQQTVAQALPPAPVAPAQVRPLERSPAQPAAAPVPAPVKPVAVAPPAPPQAADSTPAAEAVQGPVAARTARSPAAEAASRRTGGMTPQAATTGADGSAQGRILAMSELPEAIRRELPPLTVGGSIYSEHPASRFLILNGQIFHENDKVGPNLTLEQIRLKLAVLRYKDVRFRIMY